VTSADDFFMEEAVAEATLGLESGELPIGAVVVLGDDVVARAHWRLAGRLLDHPELVALMDAERNGNVATASDRRSATLYTTLEPCALCMSAAMSFLLGRVVFALESPSDGAANLPTLWRPADGHPRPGAPPYAIPEVVGGVGRAKSLALVERFLQEHAEAPIATWARTLLRSA
jgi:tRNA(adenine34) deaminase